MMHRDTLTAQEMALASVACERAALDLNAPHMIRIADELRKEAERRKRDETRPKGSL